MKKKFILDEKDLLTSIHNFMSAPEYWREAVSSHPIYFGHYKMGEQHFFGLSKFCAFKTIHLADYISHFRDTENGTTTKNHIKTVTKKNWIPFNQESLEIQNAFTKWFFNFYPKSYNLQNIYILSLGNQDSHIYVEQKKSISPEELSKKLKNQVRIGKVGEEIALNYEINRLEKLNINEPEKWIDHVAKRNSAAGYDIWSHPSNHSVRYIEVKSSTKDPSNFYITQNEIKAFEKHKENSFLYLVLISSLKNKTGKVINAIQNPIKLLEADVTLEPILYKAQLQNTKS